MWLVGVFFIMIFGLCCTDYHNMKALLFLLQDTRTERVDSWRDFQQKGSKKKKKKTMGAGGLKPPKLKQEKR